MKPISSTLKIASLLAMILSFSQVQAGNNANKDVIGMLFYADWCGSCQILDPKIESAKKDFAGKPILFSKFDLTSEATRLQSAKLSKEIGMETVFAENGFGTGFFLLVDAKSKKVIKRITRIHTEEEIKAEINAALESRA